MPLWIYDVDISDNSVASNLRADPMSLEGFFVNPDETAIQASVGGEAIKTLYISGSRTTVLGEPIPTDVGGIPIVPGDLTNIVVKDNVFSVGRAIIMSGNNENGGVGDPSPGWQGERMLMTAYVAPHASGHEITVQRGYNGSFPTPSPIDGGGVGFQVLEPYDHENVEITSVDRLQLGGVDEGGELWPRGLRISGTPPPTQPNPLYTFYTGALPNIDPNRWYPKLAGERENTTTFSISFLNFIWHQITLIAHRRVFIPTGYQPSVKQDIMIRLQSKEVFQHFY